MKQTDNGGGGGGYINDRDYTRRNVLFPITLITTTATNHYFG